MKRVFRKKGQSILIGDEIKVTIQQTKKENVVVGVDAPEDMPVRKNEIYLHGSASEQDRDAIWRKILGDDPIELQ
jgi:carbon storage regulator